MAGNQLVSLVSRVRYQPFDGRNSQEDGEKDAEQQVGAAAGHDANSEGRDWVEAC